MRTDFKSFGGWAVALATLFMSPVRASDGPLPSWNEVASKKAILAFVAKVTEFRFEFIDRGRSNGQGIGHEFVRDGVEYRPQPLQLVQQALVGGRSGAELLLPCHAGGTYSRDEIVPRTCAPCDHVGDQSE